MCLQYDSVPVMLNKQYYLRKRNDREYNLMQASLNLNCNHRPAWA